MGIDQKHLQTRGIWGEIRFISRRPTFRRDDRQVSHHQINAPGERGKPGGDVDARFGRDAAASVLSW
jgi:hypothetical protein